MQNCSYLHESLAAIWQTDPPQGEEGLVREQDSSWQKKPTESDKGDSDQLSTTFEVEGKKC